MLLDAVQHVEDAEPQPGEAGVRPQVLHHAEPGHAPPEEQRLLGQEPGHRLAVLAGPRVFQSGQGEVVIRPARPFLWLVSLLLLLLLWWWWW